MAYVAPTTRADGYVVDASEWNKNTVDNPAALRSGEIAVTSQAANDLIIATSATQLGRVAAGTVGQVLQAGASGLPAWVANAQTAMCGRLTLTSATPVTTADVTAATTLYYALYAGNQVTLYNGSAWQRFTIAQLSIAVPATTSTMYDVFVDYNSGTPALALLAWTNDTTRATALTTQDGVYVLTGSTGKRYVGSFRTTTVSGQTEDSAAKRFVWNYYNRVDRAMQLLVSTANWTYNTATWRQANNSTTNQVACVVGVAEDAIEMEVFAGTSNSGVAVQGNYGYVGVGVDSTTAPTGWQSLVSSQLADAYYDVRGGYNGVLSAGYHYLAHLENASATATRTWYGGSQRAGILTRHWRA